MTDTKAESPLISLIKRSTSSQESVARNDLAFIKQLDNDLAAIDGHIVSELTRVLAEHTKRKRDIAHLANRVASAISGQLETGDS